MNARRRGVKTQHMTWTERIGGIKRFVVTLLVLAAILYVASFFIVRTDGFRYMVEERLRDTWEWPVRVERVWLNPDWSLVVAGIESEGFETREGPGIVLDEIQLDWSMLRLLHPRRSALRRMHVYGGLFSFRSAADDVWQPVYFHADALILAEWFGIRVSDPVNETVRFVEGAVDLRITGGDVYWWNEDDECIAALRGLSFESDRTELLNDPFRYIRMSADEVFTLEEVRRQVTRKWLWVNDTMIRFD